MKKNKKYGNGGSLFLTKPYGGSVANSSVTPGQLPDYQMGSNVNSGVIQNNLRDIQHFYGNNFPYMAEGGDMEDESGATDSFYTNKLNGFIDRVRGTAQKNLENNLLKEAMREMRGDDETVEYGPQDMEMAQYGMSTGDQSQNTYDDSYINNFANAYSKTKSFTDSLQDFARMSRIIKPTTEYQKIKRKFDLGFTDRFKEDNPWVNDDGSYKNVTRATFQDGGTLIPMFQGDEDPSTVDFWSPEEMQYLQSLSKADRDAIISKGDTQAKQHVQTVIGSKSPPQVQTQPQAQPTPKSGSTQGAAPTTANNTSVNTTGTPNGFDPIGVDGSTSTMKYNGNPAATNTNPFDGYTWHTDANGNKYIVTAEGQLYSPYKGAASSDNVYTPQAYENPYYTDDYAKTYSFLDRNKLTPEFREAMRSGALNNPDPQVIGRPHIEYRKALFPKNRNKEIKSISWQYGSMYGNPFDEGVDLRPDPANPNTTPGTTPNTTPQASSTAPTQDMDRMFAQISDNEKKYFATEGDFSDRTKKNWKDQKMVTSDMYDTPEKVKEAWDKKVMGNPTKKAMWDAYSDMPPALKDIAADHIFNSKSDPRIFTLAAAGAIDMKDSRKYKDDPKLLEETWNKNKDLVNQQYNDDPQAFTESVSAHRNIIYSKLRADDIPTGEFDPKTGIEIKKPNDWLSTDLGPGVQYNAWSGRTNNTQDYLDRTYFDPATGYVPYAPPTAYAAPTNVAPTNVVQPTVVQPTVNTGPVTATLPNPVTPGGAYIQSDANTGMGENVRVLPSTDELLGRLQSMPDNSVRQRLQYMYNSGQLNPKQFQAELELAGFRSGGSLNKFIRRYDDGGPFGSAQPGTTPIMDWSLPSAQEMIQNHMNSLYDNKLDLGVKDMFGKPMSHDFSTDKIDLGVKDLNGKPIVTDLSDLSRKMKSEDTGDSFRGIKNPFNVKEEYKNRKKRDPYKTLRNINLAAGFFNLDENAGLMDQLKKATQASEAFADVGNSWGQYHPLTGQYMGPKGKQPPVMNTGFAQYGGSLYDNLKQGDEMYLTQEQIDQLLKRGVKLSYLD